MGDMGSDGASLLSVCGSEFVVALDERCAAPPNRIPATHRAVPTTVDERNRGSNETRSITLQCTLSRRRKFTGIRRWASIVAESFDWLNAGSRARREERCS